MGLDACLVVEQDWCVIIVNRPLGHVCLMIMGFSLLAKTVFVMELLFLSYARIENDDEQRSIHMQLFSAVANASYHNLRFVGEIFEHFKKSADQSKVY